MDVSTEITYQYQYFQVANIFKKQMPANLNTFIYIDDALFCWFQV